MAQTLTPSITPSYGSDYDVKPYVRVVQFGDGYAQRVQDGIKASQEKYNLTWNAINESQKNELKTFFDNNGAGVSFYWQNFEGVTKSYYYVEPYKIIPIGYQSYDFKISIIETTDS